MEPVSLRKAFEEYVKKKRLDKKLLEQKVFNAWSKMMGKLEKYIKPVIFKKGKLFLSASSSVWINEISVGKEEIIKGINDIIGEEKVKDIIFIKGDR